MNMISWAENEVKLACKHENPNCEDDEFDYGCACYKSALNAFKSLCNDEHSGFSIKVTQAILNRLIDGNPLTPIEDIPEVWSDITEKTDDYICYQCRRKSSLFKYLYNNGSIVYKDIDLCYCININTDISYQNGFVNSIIHEMFPINMPYTPSKPIKVFCEEFLVDENNGDFDTFGILYCIKEENYEPRKIEINRFFKEGEHDFIEISKEEYETRKSNKIK